MAALERENQALRAENILLREEIAQLKKLLFRSKRERYKSAANPHQGKLFDEPLEETEAQETEVVVVKKQKKAKSRKGIKRNVFPASLRREERIILPPLANLDQYTQIGQDITELLAYTPASLYVKSIIRPRLVDKENEDKGVVQAPIEPRLIPKGMVDESLIAQIIVEKIQFHTPVHRFAKKLKQAGIGFIKQNNLHNCCIGAPIAYYPCII